MSSSLQLKETFLKSLRSLDKIQECQAKYNIFTSIRPSSLLKDKLNKIHDLGNADGKLSCQLAVIKDNIVTMSEPTTCASKMLRDYRSPFESTITKILEENGTVIIGKTNLDEFGMGSATTHSIFGATLNPLFPEEKRVAGGSSGGTAAAVASGLANFGIGTDTGGSVRLPAAYCGVLGFKPSYGRISRWGVIAYAQSLDTVGIIANDLDTVREVYKILNKYDVKDPTSLDPEKRAEIDDLVSKEYSRPDRNILKIGVAEEFNVSDLSPEVSKAWFDCLSKLQKAGHEIIKISIPSIKNSLPAYYTLAPAEASSNLARYDGIRYGFRFSDSSSKDSENGVLFAPTRTKGFGDEVKRRILMGTYNLSSEAFENNFIKAQLIRKQLRVEFDQIFRFENILSRNKVNDSTGIIDFLISPTSMTAAPKLEDFEAKDHSSPTNSYVNDVLTIPASLAGLPTISIPWRSSNDVPIGIQIMGQFGDDDRVLQTSEILKSLDV
ncbi:hypothetical protein PACTADRAFT_36766 [Pachysolen tannophilus NRRL Y-2460]|uniref:Glutamyl-tRNA(Gln) amidotransferase subunit A, mitochondrial n=1 Tax=Pachysolen tannophilus NRRL Y-2460 TaxID=669874 RepID=A0A1E4U0Q9_PACTA|nr:hypothetical protein PACTADRAFT_36766 [Pachysolen tannophilus NRRL Y-2460]